MHERVRYEELGHTITMKQLIETLTKPYYGSNQISRALRSWIDGIPFRQLIGLHLAGLTFVTAVIAPRVGELDALMKVMEENAQTTVEAAPIQATRRWPISSFSLSQRFSISHPGIDLTAAYGTDVYPTENGVVSWVTNSAWGYGKHLLIEHEQGIKSLYAHLSTLNVADQQPVTTETKIGQIGSSGWSTGSHLHLEIYQDGTPVNPLEVLPLLISNR